MIKGLMGQCLNHEMVLDRVRLRANETEDELNGLKAWKVGMEKKLDMSKKVRKELEEHMEMMKRVLEDKEKEIKDARDQLHQAKEVAICEYRNSDTLLEELGTSYANGFDDTVHQAKKAYLDLDFLNLILMRKPRPLLNLSPLRVRRIYLLMMQSLAMGSQLMLKAKPSPLMVMFVSLRAFKKMLKTPPLISSFFFFFFLGIVTIWRTAF